MSRPFFWLHVKKSAGQTVRRLLHPYYVEVDRADRPKCFIQADKSEYNDILNNYRVVLGEYQFKRCLFAKTYLYKDEWDSLFSFAFSREPVERCLSMFYYLYGMMKRTLPDNVSLIKYVCSRSYAFDYFLENVEMARMSSSIYRPISNHFTTHTAPMWDDVCDKDGNILLNKIYRVEDIEKAINNVFEECNLEKRVSSEVRLNTGRKDKSYCPSRNQLNKIKKIYEKDFFLYESAVWC